MKQQQQPTTTLKDLTRKVTIIKRHGSKEPFSKAKLNKCCIWATDGNETTANELMESTHQRLKDEIHISKMYRALIDNAVSKISRLTPHYAVVASKLELLEIYSASYGMKDKTYPPLGDVLKKGVATKTYNRDIYNKWSEEEIDELGAYLVQERDYLYSHSALIQFNGKYCKKYSKRKKLELPQHTYMRVAMGLTYNLEDKVMFAKRLYDIISLHVWTFGSPVMINSFTNKSQFASCVLSTIENSTFDIMNKLMTAGLYTKGAGGLAFDVSLIQAKGSMTQAGVLASGLVPYIQNIQAVVKSMQQGENRRGAAVITCQWWHYEIESFLLLKDNGGTHDTRAEDLKYALATTQWLYNAMENDEDVYLFDPLDARALYWAKDDDEFAIEYKKLVDKHGIRKKKVSARQLFKLSYIKNEFQTGNVYETRLSNCNPNMTGRKINSSNLCAEILIPSRPSKFVAEQIVTVDGKETIHTISEGEETALCNLASFNMKYLVPEKRAELEEQLGLPLQEIFYTIHKILDNTIEIGHYPRASGKKANIDSRAIGLGVSNQAYYMAKLETKYSSDEAPELIYKAFQEMNYMRTKSNIRLAKELGTPPRYKDSLWAKGIVLYDLANPILKEKFAHLHNKEWEDELREGIRMYGVRNVLSSAIMPTASCLKLNLNTEIKIYDLVFEGEGGETITLHNNEKVDVVRDGKSISVIASEIKEGDEIHTTQMIVKSIKQTTTNINGYDLLESANIPHKTIEANNAKGWYRLENNIPIPTNSGDSVIEAAYYNGFVDTTTVSFSNNTSEDCTLEHKFKVSVQGGTIWKEVGELLVDDEIVVDGGPNTTVLGLTSAGKAHTWDFRVPTYHEYILGSGVVTHNSGAAIGALESIEPILDFSYTIDGAIESTFVVPEFTTLNKHYEKAYDIDQYRLVLLAGIRQMWLDQSQSINTYIAEENWNYQYLVLLHMFANKIGVKTSYYMTTPKQDALEACDSCGA